MTMRIRNHEYLTIVLTTQFQSLIRTGCLELGARLDSSKAIMWW